MIKLLSQNFYKELSTAPTTWLLGNPGDKIRVETSVSVETFAVSSLSSPIIVNHTDGRVGIGWWFDPQGQFEDFNIGDTVLYTNRGAGGSATFTVIDKLDGSSIQLNTNFPTTGVNFEETDVVITVTTPITCLKYRYNCIKNNDANNFISAVDGVSEQLFLSKNKSASDVTASAMLPSGPLTWQDGLAGSLTSKFDGTSTPVATIEGIAIDDGTTDGVYKSKFKIVHYTTIPKYLLFLVDIPPYKDDNCPKFITQIDALYEYTNPNFGRSQIFDSIDGNVGWYNENFATGATKYSISDVTYTNAGNSIDSIQLDASETTITFKINNTTDTPFSNNNTNFVLEFFKIPADYIEYQGNNTLMDVNFLFDRGKQIVGSAAVNGDNYGGVYQVLKSISATFVSSSVIIVTAKINMSPAVLASFTASLLAKYYLSVSIQNHVLATDVSDLVTLEIDSQEFVVITSDPTMIVASNVFIRHPEANPATEGYIPTGLKASGSFGNNPFSASTDWLIVDLVNNKTIGVAANAGSPLATLTALVNSINTNTPLGIIFGGFPAFGNAGFTASAPFPIGGGQYGVTITAPAGAIYNTPGITLVYKGNAGDSSGVDMTGGSDAQPIDVFPQDELVACSNFYIESAGRTTDEIKLISVLAKIKVDDGTKEFDLDSYLTQLSSYPLIGYTQQFDVQIARSFHIPVGTIRKYIEVKRRTDLDTGTKKYFSANYPFLFRWETWTAALGVDASFFNSSLPNNGFNEWWFHYKTGAWKIYYEITINATKNGVAQQYKLQQEINPNDYASNVLYTTKDTLPFEAADLTLLLSGTGGATQLVSGNTTYVTINGQKYYTNGDNFVPTYKKSLIVGVFTKTTMPSSAVVEIDVEVYQKGGISGKRRYSSKWVADSDTWFSSIDGSGKVVLYAYGNSVIALCYFDPASLNFPGNVTDWSFSSRIYEIGGVLSTDDGVPITDDDGNQLTID